MRLLDLGCGGKKIPNSFAVDFLNYPGVDLRWNLNKELPKKYHNKFDLVHTKRTLDHLGNPLGFLEGCSKYLKKKW